MDVTSSDGRLTAAELTHEEDVVRRPFVLKAWLRYVEALLLLKRPERLFAVYERALKALPGSYKLWWEYLRARVEHANGRHPNSPVQISTADVFERAVVYMHKMPVVWAAYIQFLIEQKRWASARRVSDRSLQSLPVTQHARIWKVYLEVAQQCGVPSVGAQIMRRFCKVDPRKGVEQLFKFLVHDDKYDEAVSVLARVLDQPKFESATRSRHEMFHDVVKVIVEHPAEVRCVDGPAVIRAGIERTQAEVGSLWVSLAEYYARLGVFEMARDVYEEAMVAVKTVRDFVLVFDAYAQLEEAVVTSKMETGADPNEIDLLLARLERLTDRRPMLLSSVLLRQNPHNVREWHKRVDLFLEQNDLSGAVQAFSEAIRKVEPWKASGGKPHTLWLAYARLYEENEDFESAKKILETAASQPEKFRGPDDLAALYCEYAEMELRRGAWKEAQSVVEKRTQEPPRTRKKVQQIVGNAKVALSFGAGNTGINYIYEKESAAAKAWRSPRLHALRIDLTQSFEGLDDVQKAYERVLDHKIASIEMLLNAADFLWERDFFEHSFKVYERGIGLFEWPGVFALWVPYLSRFLERFGGRKLERARELFEEALKDAPADFQHTKVLYVLYSHMEEQYGLVRHAMSILGRGARALAGEKQAEMYRLVIVKTAELLGLPKTRALFEEAVEKVNDRLHVMEFCGRFATVETLLGEVDRARAVYKHGAQVADPRGGAPFESYWKSWREFEVAHGSEDTFKEMLRTKRSVEMRHTSLHLVTPAAANTTSVEEAVTAADVSNTAASGGLEALERKALADGGSGADAEVEKAPAGNREEISLDLDDGDGESEPDDPNADENESDEPAGREKKRKRDVEFEEKKIPDAVFAGVAADSDETQPAAARQSTGALARFKNKT